MDWVALFCSVDDFCQQFEPAMHARVLHDGSRKRRRKCRLALSEMLTIVIAFHLSHFRDFKSFLRASVRKPASGLPKLDQLQ